MTKIIISKTLDTAILFICIVVFGIRIAFFMIQLYLLLTRKYELRVGFT